MENQDFNKELLDYIYGEMSANEKKEFEVKLKSDNELQSEYKALTEVRDELESLKDKEVMEPFSAWAKQRSSYWFKVNQKRRLVVFRPITAVAASLVILMLVGYLTNFTISMNNNGFHAGFGTGIVNDEHYLSKDEVASLVSLEVQRSNKELITRLAQAEDNYDQKLTTLEASISSMENSNRNNVVTNADLQKFLTNTENKNTEIMREYLKMTSTQQQEYFKTMLTQFNAFYQKQREEDLNFIQANLVEMKQNQTIQKQETDQAIASLYTSVSQRGN